MQVSKQAKEFASLILQYYGCKEQDHCHDAECAVHREQSSIAHNNEQNDLNSLKEPDQDPKSSQLVAESSKQKPSAGTEYQKWESLAKQLDSEEQKEGDKKDDPKNQVWGCSQDHRKERDIYERPNSEKMKIAEDFKKQGDTAYKQQKLEEADYCYHKVLKQ